MRRRKPQLWHTDIRARLRFERGVRARHPVLRCSTVGRGHGALVTYQLTVPIPEYEARNVTIELVNGYSPFGAKITVDGPTESPHRYSDKSLCIWFPSDSEERKWVGDDGLGELIRQIAVHLFKEAYWRETGEWLGAEAPHASPKHPDDRRTES
jgi:hypothetical protein